MSNVSEMVDSADQAKEELVANLRRVISDAEDLLAATAGDADSKIAELRARARQNLAVARDKLADADAALRAPRHERHRRLRARQPLVVHWRGRGHWHAGGRAAGPPLMAGACGRAAWVGRP